MLNGPTMRRTANSSFLVCALTAAFLVAIVATCATVLGGCATDGAVDDELAARDEEWGMEGAGEPTPLPGKEAAEHRRGILVATNTSRTQVWTARNRWEDVDTAAARAAGVAWGEGSGLTWDAKYQAWIAALAPTPSGQGYQTFVLTTPWGKTLPSPSLECAEMSLFLRTTFAAWYALPLFFEAQDGGKRVYFGHNGVRTATGRHALTPEFAIAYRDDSALSPAQYQAAWPHDATLRARKVHGGIDAQTMIAPDATMGTYLDEIHLNKRAAYFTLMVLNYLGSMNLADSANTYNIVPEAVRPGDVLIERWQKNGIGHTLVVKEVIQLGEGNKDVITLSGSMPRRQGKRESGVASKSYFTSAYAGGAGANLDGDEYVKLGGGLKRYRVTKNVGGYWTNTWMVADEAHWINSTDWSRLSARPARFESMLGQVSPQQMKTELLAQIDDARRHLGNFPASCSARERRERAFEDLYDLMERDFATPRVAVDTEYRQLDDYVLAELVYGQSKTCCWNSTTSAMAEVVRGYAAAEQHAAAVQGQCVAPTVFMGQDDGYRRWSDYAEGQGSGAAWRPWSEDESCAQRDVGRDREAAHAWEAFCSLEDDGGDGCTDALEPSDGQATARVVGAGAWDGLRVCSGDVDWYRVDVAATVRLELVHAAGDLDMTAHDASGARLAASESTSDRETLTVSAGTWIKVYGYQGATNAYRLVVP